MPACSIRKRRPRRSPRVLPTSRPSRRVRTNTATGLTAAATRSGRFFRSTCCSVSCCGTTITGRWSLKIIAATVPPRRSGTATTAKRRRRVRPSTEPAARSPNSAMPIAATFNPAVFATPHMHRIRIIRPRRLVAPTMVSELRRNPTARANDLVRAPARLRAGVLAARLVPDTALADAGGRGCTLPSHYSLGGNLSKSALVTGITGQDGSYLSELLLSKGYTVHGIVRRSSSFNTSRINHIYEDPHNAGRRLILHYADLTDSTGLRRTIETALPDEIYNLGAQSHVKVSFENPEYTADADALGTLRLLDCMRDHVLHTGRHVRFYQAGSSEMFGAAKPPQNESTAFYPRSPYAVSKVAAHWYAINYREAYNLFISNGILFNHESPRRGETFVTRKITRAVGRIKVGLQKKLFLGNLEARRDWGFAGDYVEAMWRMLQHSEPGDFVISTGEAHSVRDFAEAAFAHAGLDW